jgi:pimeloyl-ACP methyl ester carboxylesterase
MGPIMDDIVEQGLWLEDLGVRTRVLVAGDGPPVVMLHGNPDNADEWRPLISRLAATNRCIAPDFPGYGRSPLPPASFSYSLADQMRFLDRVLDELQVTEEFVMVVHDTGGMTGTAWAAAHPERLRGLVFTNTVVFEDFAWFAIARGWGRRSLVGRIRSQLAMMAIGLRGGLLFKRLFGSQNPQLSPTDLDRFAASFAVNPDAKETALRQFRQIMRPDFFGGFEEMRARLVERVPCRVLWGEGDPYISATYARAFGPSAVTILPGVGHWVPLLAPDRLAAEVLAIA